METNTYTIANYTFVPKPGGGLAIHYNRTLKDYYYAIVYTIIALPILAMAGFIFWHMTLKYKDIATAVFGIILALLFATVAVFLLNVSVAYCLKPGRKVFYANAATQILTIKKHRFKTVTYRFDDIVQLTLHRDFSTVENNINGKRIRRPLRLYNLTVETKKDKQQVHVFEMPNFILPADKSYGLFTRNCSRISQSLAQACSTKLRIY